MKQHLPAIVAFLLTFAVGAGGAAFLRPAPTPTDPSADTTHVTPHQDPAAGTGLGAANDSTHADTGGPSAVADTTGHDQPATDDSAAPALRTEPHASAATATTGAAALTELMRSQSGRTVALGADGRIGPPDAANASRDASDAAAGPDYGRLARLLGRMAPRDAARTLEQLPPEDAAQALAGMPDKQAAAVLQQLAPEKAAFLLKTVIALLPRTGTP